MRGPRRRGRGVPDPFARRASATRTCGLDATYLKVREAGRVVSMAALVATGVARTGERGACLALELGPGHDEGSAWPRFIRSLVERGLAGVLLVISDDHAGLVKAVRGASSWVLRGSAAAST